AKASTMATYELEPLAAIHMLPPRPGRGGFGDNVFKPAGDMATVKGSALTGGLILLIALANFVKLMSARASRRAVEVGVRKTSGAQRVHLLVQFMGESFAYVIASLLAAIGIVELVLPAFNGFLGRGIVFDFVHEPTLRAGIFMLAV